LKGVNQKQFLFSKVDIPYYENTNKGHHQLRQKA